MGVQVPLSAPEYISHFPLARKIIILLTLITGMKGFRLFFYVCLGMLAFGHAVAVDGEDTARAATRRTTTQSVTNPTRAAPTAATPNINATARNTVTVPRIATTESRGATTQPTTVVPRTVSARSTTRSAVQNRTSTTPGIQPRRTVSLQSKGLSRVFSNTTVQKHQFFGAQPSSQSNSHIHT